MKPWAERPTELAYLFNPAYCGLLLREAIDGYNAEKPEGMFFPLAFLVLPVVLHRHTRELLPRGITTALQPWLQEHPQVHVTMVEQPGNSRPLHSRSPVIPWNTRSSDFLGERFDDDGSQTQQWQGITH